MQSSYYVVMKFHVSGVIIGRMSEVLFTAHINDPALPSYAHHFIPVILYPTLSVLISRESHPTMCMHLQAHNFIVLNPRISSNPNHTACGCSIPKS